MAGRGGAGLATVREHEELDDGRVPHDFKRMSSDAMLALEDIEMKEEIGRGGFSHVYLGTYKGAQVAVKKMPLVDKDAVKYLDSELAILKNFDSPYLIKYHGAAIRGKEVYIVTEFMRGGDLSTILSKHTDVPLPWRLRCRIARDAAEGIVTLHDTEVVHRDIKTESEFSFYIEMCLRTGGCSGKQLPAASPLPIARCYAVAPVAQGPCSTPHAPCFYSVPLRLPLCLCPQTSCLTTAGAAWLRTTASRASPAATWP